MSATALLLLEADEGPAVARVKAVLAVLGISGALRSASELAAQLERHTGPAELRLLASSAAFARLTEVLQASETLRAAWRRGVHSVFVFRSDAESTVRVIRAISGDPRAALVTLEPAMTWAVTDQHPAICRSMSGVREIPAQGADEAMRIAPSATGPRELVASAAGAGFAQIEFDAVPVFVSSAEVIDLDAPLGDRSFDVRSEFLRAVPLVIYLRWACASLGWEPPQARACLVIDDPILKPRYGQLRFERLCELMQGVGFSTSIAFIPLNWRRNARRTVELLRKHPTRFSLCVHGCDHTSAEFGSEAPDWLAWKAQQALQRMDRLASRTGLRYDPVMVFPQGNFSAAAMDVLKRSGFAAAVNTEVFSCAGPTPPISVGDYWRIALTNYSDFPIFTRRYPSAGVVNFAFDLLLGKPALVVAHHGDCRDDCRHIAEFIGRLNRINADLRWSSLGEVVRGAFAQRRVAPDRLEVEMLSNEIDLANPAVHTVEYRIRKPESAAESLSEVLLDDRPIEWSAAPGAVNITVRLGPQQSASLRIRYLPPSAPAFAGESWRYRCGAILRRYLSEWRDDYLAPLAMRMR